ncbi:MAG TPA: aldehyde dehydrogenase family protein [Phycisphaerae bacterium]|nr:aldehyde dehydrogenase family protein [Phycisphaerae bacterium]
MLHIPILRFGQPYYSADTIELVNHADGSAIARVSQANSGLLARDVSRMDHTALERFTIRELIALCRKAADLFMHADLPLGDPAGPRQTFDDYVRQLSATTGMPVSYCRANAAKIHRVMDEIEPVLRGLLRGLDFSILDRGWGEQDGRVLSFFRAGRIFGAVLPSNSPGVHSLWIPALTLKAPIVLKPGREEPWSPLRIIEALAAAGAPREALGFYPTDHAGAAELLRCVDRAMLFGDASTTRAWADDPRIELHGPGYSKVVLGDDATEHWEQHLDLIASSIAANGGRSCVNASAVFTPRHGRALAEGLAQRLAGVAALPADDPRAELAAFANPKVAEAIDASIAAGLREPGAVDLTEQVRGAPRLVRRGRVAWLLPTIIWCERPDHALANREFLFPYAAVVECAAGEIPRRIGRSLVVSAITSDERLTRALMASADVDRLNIGAIPTWQISWDQPHEGNLFEHLYRQRAFQHAAVGA